MQSPIHQLLAEMRNALLDMTALARRGPCLDVERQEAEIARLHKIYAEAQGRLQYHLGIDSSAPAAPGFRPLRQQAGAPPRSTSAEGPASGAGDSMPRRNP
ncbi:MAG TPA: hypothetical protein VLH09_10355 [Bryobacteraceae bacterium]|nr:hypothetical protein [Bryobacteraceae bacterium]